MLELYEALKIQFLAVTHSQYAIPLLDFIFSTPVFQPGQARWPSSAPSRSMLTTMLLALHRAGLLTMVRQGSGRLPYIWELTPLIELAERRF